MNVVDRCKELVKLAKSSEKENRVDSLELYKQAAECFGENDDTKGKNANLEKAAVLLKEMAKLSESPIIAFDHYEQSAKIYTEIGNEKETTRIMQEAHQNFLNVAMKIRSETKKINDIDLAEQRLALASEYALQGKDEKLSSNCWIDLGDQIRQVAMNIEDPREAHKVFNRAIANYRKGQVETKEFVTLKYIAEKYHKKANEILNSKKQFAQALENYNQASKFYNQIKSEEKAQACEKKIQEICDLIGVSKNAIVDFIESQPKKIVERSTPQMAKGIPIGTIDDKPQKVVNNYFEELKKREDDVGKPLVQQESVVAPKIELKKENIKHDEIIKTEDVELLDEEKSIPDFMEDLETKIKSSEAIKKRIKKEIQEGKPKVQKEKRGEKKKTKEINKLFDKALDGIKEDTDHRIAEVVIAENMDEKPTIPEPIVDISKEEPAIPPKFEIPKDVAIEKTPTTSSDPVNEIVNEFANFKPELKPVTDIPKIEEKPKARDPIIERLKINDETESEPKPSTLNSKGADTQVIGPHIIDILKKQGYMKTNYATEEEMLQIPEYQILSLIVKQHPIPLEQIEEISRLESISLVLSNLQADGLITQTNDYRWTISQMVKDNLQKPMHDPVPHHVDSIDVPRLRSLVKRNAASEHQFISMMYEFGLIPNRDRSITSLMTIPEFAIIRTIKDNEPVELAVIKEELSSIPPVQVNRILSRLENDYRISQNDDGLWQLSDEFIISLVGNK